MEGHLVLHETLPLVRACVRVPFISFVQQITRDLENSFLIIGT